MRQPLSEIMRIVNATGGHLGFKVLFGSHNSMPKKRTIMMSIPKSIKNANGEVVDGEESFNLFIKNLKMIAKLDTDCSFEILNKRDEVFNEEPIIKFRHFPYFEYLESLAQLLPSLPSETVETIQNGGVAE